MQQPHTPTYQSHNKLAQRCPHLINIQTTVTTVLERTSTILQSSPVFRNTTPKEINSILHSMHRVCKEFRPFREEKKIAGNQKTDQKWIPAKIDIKRP